jgi:predicted protein tyrosine phosphatase
MIIVCPYSAVLSLVVQHKVGRVVSLLAPETDHLTIEAIDRARHLRLTFHDIVQETGGLVTPRREDAEELVRFLDEWDKVDPLLIHCWAGISRSTAACFTAMCMAKPDRSEEELAWMIRERSPYASPNRLIVSHADALLGRGGRMVAAVDAIGRGREAVEGVPFTVIP